MIVLVYIGQQLWLVGDSACPSVELISNRNESLCWVPWFHHWPLSLSPPPPHHFFITIIIFIITRPKPAYGREGLAQTWDLSKILHCRIFRPKILHCKFRRISKKVKEKGEIQTTGKNFTRTHREGQFSLAFKDCLRLFQLLKVILFIGPESIIVYHCQWLTSV